MKTGIRAKLVGILALATLIPLAITIVAVQTVGYRHLVKARGTTFQTGAAHVAHSLSLLAQAHIEQVQDFVTLDRVYLHAAATNQQLAGPAQDAATQQAQTLESRWGSLQPDAPELVALLRNPLALELKAFQKQHPLLAEMFVTDRVGRLIASTGKTSDYWQADEVWWERTIQTVSGGVWLEGLHFDESSDTFSLDIAVPVTTPEGETVGALKASLNSSPLFSSIPTVLPERRPACDIVRADGTVLLRLRDPKFVPGSLTMAESSMAVLRTRPAGWFDQALFGTTKTMAGFAVLRLQPIGSHGPVEGGLVPMFVVVHEPVDVALRPVRGQVTFLTLIGAVLMFVFGAAGLWVANRKIIGPLGLLRNAARAVAGTVRPVGAGPAVASTVEAAQHLERLTDVRNGDEFEELARDFQLMGQRVLQYQQQLELDIAAKTATIERDLEMARDFQTALMPEAYPTTPDSDHPDALRLSFHHLYRAASTVGGDFFDVIRLSDHQAGIFIADVMGHGARSALITAMLRTLVQTYAKQTADPAELLSQVNRHFHELINKTRETVFVTAVYVVVDTLTGKLTCASAGHLSPLLVRRATGAIEPLFTRLKGNPALGLFPVATYTTYSHVAAPGDLVVLFTDGVLEATDPQGNEFGSTGLVAVLEKHLDGTDNEVVNAISTALNRFSESGRSTDDICLVVLGFRPRGSESNVATTSSAVAATDPDEA